MREAPMAAALRPGLPAGPPPGRGGRLLRRGVAWRLGHAPGQLRRASRTCRRRSIRPCPPWSRDLKDRGLLDSTLVIWMGEFGRTPRINAQASRPRPLPAAWSTVLAGGGIKGGQVIGKTDKDGATVDGTAHLRHRLHGHRLHGPRHRPHQAEHDAQRPADPHRRQGREADPGTVWLRARRSWSSEKTKAGDPSPRPSRESGPPLRGGLSTEKIRHKGGPPLSRSPAERRPRPECLRPHGRTH